MAESMLDRYIRLCDEFLASDHDPEAAIRLIEMVCSSYEHSVRGLRGRIVYFTADFDYELTPQDYCDDILKLRDKLIAYKELREYDLEMARYKSPSVQMSQVQNVDLDISAVFNNTIKTVFEINDDVLGMDQKTELMQLLADLDKTIGQPKETRAEAARKALAWLGDKAADVLVAAVPYIAAVLQAA